MSLYARVCIPGYARVRQGLPYVSTTVYQKHHVGWTDVLQKASPPLRTCVLHEQMTGNSIATPYTPAVLVKFCSLHGASKAGGEAYLVVDEGPGVRHSGIIHFGPGMVAHPGSPESVAGDIHGLQAGAVPLNVKGSQVCQCSSQRVPCNNESRSQCI